MENTGSNTRVTNLHSSELKEREVLEPLNGAPLVKEWRSAMHVRGGVEAKIC